jgi:scyllo-inositol 2-dehydrogenase (NADP+)
MKKIRVAIIGYGRSGRNIHRGLLTQLPELYEIAAIVDEDPQRQEMIKAEAGFDALHSYTDIFKLDNIDLIVNASYSHQHQPISYDCLEHGYNVLSEKPAATNQADFAKLLDAAEKHGCRYHVFQQYRFSAAFQKIQEVIASGVLGRVVHIGMNYGGFSRRWDWQTIHDMAAGSLLNTGPHPVDHTLALMGFPEDVQVFCAMDRALTSGTGEDYVKLILKAPNGPVGDIEITSCNAFREDTFLIQGTKGTLKGNTKHLDWKYYIPENEPERPVTTIPLRDENGEPIYCREKLTIHEASWDASGEQENDGNFKGLAFYRSLYRALVENVPFEIDNSHIMLQMKVMEEAHKQNTDLFKLK